VWRAYHARHGVDTTTGERGMIGLPPFDDMVAAAFVRFLLTPGGGQHAIPTKARAWRNAPATLRRRVYDQVRDPLREQARAVDMNADAAFPAPRTRAGARR